MRITDTHIYFWGDVFSQWYPSPFTVSGIDFLTAEHFMMWSKAITFGDNETASEILNTKSAKKAKELGRLVKNFDAKCWDDMKFRIVCEGSWYKFTSNTTLVSTLINTNHKTLVEGSPVDTVWGVGLHYDDDLILDEKNWKGQNLLGKALMNTRGRMLQFIVNSA